MISSPAIDGDLLRQLSIQHNPLQQMWLSGYLYACATRDSEARASDQALVTMVTESPKTVVTLLFGSQTGNSKKVAKQVMERLQLANCDVELRDLNDYPPKNLKNEKIVVLVVSTQGEGVPPVSAETFYQWLHSARAPRLEGLQFAVCALGDSSYLKFCQTGRDFDARFEALGAKRILERMDCDVDFEDSVQTWTASLFAKIDSLSPSKSHQASLRHTDIQASAEQKPQFDRKNPYQATLLEKIKLTGRGSAKETWHLELSLEGSGIEYQPGDALGIFSKNPDALLREICVAAAVDGRKTVEFNGEKAELREILRTKAEITTLSRDLLERYAQWTDNRKLKSILADAEQLKSFLWGRNFADLLRAYPAAMSEQTLASMLRKLSPRLYSIASSALAHPDEVHLTVAAVRYQFLDRQHWGSASTFVADQLQVGDQIPVFVEHNEYFKLPEDDRDIIMVGPGTGVAPFRAFVEERAERNASGRNWLFFGNPHFETDFLYQTEWLNYLKHGQLDRLDVAFSRDQVDKLYVQHRLLNRSKLIYERLENGAYLYVCGDKSKMALDVRKALAQIIATESGKGEDFASEYIRALQQQRRFLEDVY
jgi:sulfite reductase (NADPH) flavoprotein alpha-component